METVTLGNISRPLFRALAANANTSAFTAKAPTVTEPTNDGVISLHTFNAGGAAVPAKAMFWPIGVGADNDAYSLRVIGWRRLGNGAVTGFQTIWVPSIIAEVSCTLSGAVGVANSPVLATERFADTITIVAARQLVAIDTDSAGAASRGTVQILSPTNDTPGFFTAELCGCEKIELLFDQTTNTPTGNALVAFL